MDRDHDDVFAGVLIGVPSDAWAETYFKWAGKYTMYSICLGMEYQSMIQVDTHGSKLARITHVMLKSAH